MITQYKAQLPAYLIIVLGLFFSTTLMAYTTELSTYIKNDFILSAKNDSRSTSDIISLIKRNYSPPLAPKGTVQRSIVTITVNSNGDVVQVSALGANKKVNNAAKHAVLKTGNLPIGSSDSLYPTFSINFHGTTD